MISLKEAREKAKAKDPRVNKHVTYKNGWVFFEKPDDPEIELDKGGVAVLKSDGTVLSEAEFYKRHV